MENSESEIKIQNLVDSLLKDSTQDIKTFVSEVQINTKVKDTQVISHCYSLSLDARGKPRVKDLAQFVAQHIIDYSIPRKEIEAARKYDVEKRTTIAMAKLYKKASGLFTSLKTSGEGGEMLLYILTQEFLKLPQIICKMSLKTNSEVHYHGADGIHVSVETDKDGNDVLCLHWGESKLYQSIGEATKDCVDSLKNFLLSEGGSDNSVERDLHLLQSSVSSIDNQKLEDLLVQYFDKSHLLSNHLKFKGICLVGFDSAKYSSGKDVKTIELIKARIEKKLPEWLEKVKENVKKHSTLDTIEIDFFLIPFPDVQEFRDSFAKEIGQYHESSKED